MPETKSTLATVPSAGGVVLGRDGRILLIQHPKGGYAIPKGSAKPGESLRATALREVCEETGHVAQILWRLGTVCRQARKRHLDLVKLTEVYLLRSLGIAPGPLDEVPTWVTLDMALDDMRFPAEAELLRSRRRLLGAMLGVNRFVGV